MSLVGDDDEEGVFDDELVIILLESIVLDLCIDGLSIDDILLHDSDDAEFALDGEIRWDALC